MERRNLITLCHKVGKAGDKNDLHQFIFLPDFLGKGNAIHCAHFNIQKQDVPLSKITYIEAQKQYVVVHTDAQEYRMKASLADTERELDEYFYKCQRSFIVNLRHVLRIGSDSVVLKNGAEVPISRGMAQKIGKEIIRLF